MLGGHNAKRARFTEVAQGVRRTGEGVGQFEPNLDG